MKPIDQHELYEHFNQFLKGRGIEMKDGSYTKQLQKGCSLLTDAVNLTQQGMERAKTEIDKRLDRMRQVIHERTAPKPPVTAAAPAQPPRQEKAASKPSKPKPRRRKKAKKGGAQSSSSAR